MMVTMMNDDVVNSGDDGDSGDTYVNDSPGPKARTALSQKSAPTVPPTAIMIDLNVVSGINIWPSGLKKAIPGREHMEREEYEE